MNSFNAFDHVVETALSNRPDLALLRPVVEKELLHHDILRHLADTGILARFTFIGGTCLRMCHGSSRLSEDLDFTTAMDPETVHALLGELPASLRILLEDKYQLPVSVTEPVRNDGLVQTWKIRLTTRPDRPDLPSQRIHIDVQLLPSQDPGPELLRNPYRVDMGTSGLIVQAASRTEILADKIIAIALRPNRIKWRDVWDMVWLHQQDTDLDTSMVRRKLQDRRVEAATFQEQIQERIASMAKQKSELMQELERFLPPGDLLNAAAESSFPDIAIKRIRMLANELGRE